MSNNQLSENIENLVLKNKLEAAIGLLVEHYKSKSEKLYNQSIELNRRLIEANQNYLLGTITAENKNIQLVNVSLSILMLNNKLKNEDFKGLEKRLNQSTRLGKSAVLSLIITLFLLSLGYFIKVPIKISEEISLSFNNNAVSVVAKSNGNISSIYVANHEIVEKDDLIIMLADTATFNEIIILEKVLSDYQGSEDFQALDEISIESK